MHWLKGTKAGVLHCHKGCSGIWYSLKKTQPIQKFMRQGAVIAVSAAQLCHSAHAEHSLRVRRQNTPLLLPQ